MRLSLLITAGAFGFFIFLPRVSIILIIAKRSPVAIGDYQLHKAIKTLATGTGRQLEGEIPFVLRRLSNQVHTNHSFCCLPVKIDFPSSENKMLCWKQRSTQSFLLDTLAF